MISREELAAQIYASSYIPKKDRRINLSHCTPKEAFRAADLFLKYAKTRGSEPGTKLVQFKDATKQRATSTMSFVGGVTASDPIIPGKLGPEPCKHTFRYKTVEGRRYCSKCGYMAERKIAKEEPAKPKRAREWAILVDKNGGVLTVQDQEYNSDGRMIKVREILDTEEG